MRARPDSHQGSRMVLLLDDGEAASSVLPLLVPMRLRPRLAESSKTVLHMHRGDDAVLDLAVVLVPPGGRGGEGCRAELERKEMPQQRLSWREGEGRREGLVSCTLG